MKKYLLLILILLLPQIVFAAPSNTLSVVPVAVDATTITASDENSRNNVITTIYNAHTHTDISQVTNTLNVGDALAGDKSITAYNADTNKPYIKYDDTNNYWILSTDGSAPSTVLQGTGITFEGTTNDTYETTLSITDPTADRTITIPNDSGEVILLGGTTVTSSAAELNVLDGIAGTLTYDELNYLDGKIDLTSEITGTLPTANGGTGSTANANAANGVVVLDASAYLPDASVDTTALKTATGEVSVSATAYSNNTLPGGEYGFYPQFKMSGTTASTYKAWPVGLETGGDSYNFAGWTSYVTNLSMYTQNDITFYAKQRYITASGTDHWLFLLVDKITKEIMSAYSAPDHPAYGNGGDFDKMPHPFGSYDETKHEIILVDQDTIAELKAQVTEEKSLLTLVNEYYKPNMDKEEVYKPLHSGKYLTKDGKQVKELIENIPPYIKVRKLIALTQTEKNEKEVKRQQAMQKAEQDKIKKEQNKKSAEDKLKVLGLTKDEIEAIK